MHSRNEVFDAIWYKNVHMKVSICVWRLLCSRWPTNDNLVGRDIIPSDSLLCVSECGNNETNIPPLNSLFNFRCAMATFKTWIDLHSVDPPTYIRSFYSYGNMSKLGLVCIPWIPNIY